MNNFRFTISKKRIKKLNELYSNAKKGGDSKLMIRISVILAVTKAIPIEQIIEIFKVSKESIRLWLIAFFIKGIKGILTRKSSGRPSKLTKKQKKKLAKLIDNGPERYGFTGACWRSPMIQDMICQEFGKLYSVNYIAQLLKNMGFSYQKAKFDAASKDEQKREEWKKDIWPEILKAAKEKNGYIMFGDEASFPQWGTLTYTWARKGCQPIVKTSGIRKGYKVFGLIEYFTGKFYSKGQQGRLNSESYINFLKEVIQKTRKHIFLIHDGAPYHKSIAVKKFIEKFSKRITAYRLPSYSPDYNPIEMLWKKIKERETHLHYFPTFESLIEKVNEALTRFKDIKNEILSLFGFYNKLAI
jgi:transposase